MNRLFLAFLWFFKILFGGGKAELAELERKASLPPPKAPEPRKAPEPAPKPAAKVEAPPKAEPARGARPEDGALRLLALLQGDGRLVDFLREDIGAYSDDQVGAAVRNIHADCRRALDKVVTLEPVLAGEEGASVTVPRGFDPSAIRVVGNVRGEPPYSGALRHHGWRAKRIELPGVPSGQDLTVVAPAEVEV
ncbi:MAG: hypothetical protein AMXMBFR64_04640 [Myxococcales bacterium]